MAPDDDNVPASCGGVPASDDGVAVPDACFTKLYNVPLSTHVSHQVHTQGILRRYIIGAPGGLVIEDFASGPPLIPPGEPKQV